MSAGGGTETASLMLQERLTVLAEQLDPNLQVAILEVARPEDVGAAEYAGALLDLAASDRVASFAVRACILEEGVATVCAAERQGDESVKDLHEQVVRNLPEFSARWNGGVPATHPERPQAALHHFEYGMFFESLASEEGLSMAALRRFRPAYGDAGNMRGDIPLAAPMLLDRMVGGRAVWGEKIPYGLLHGHLPVAIDFRGEVFQHVADVTSNDRVNRLVRYASPAHAEILKTFTDLPSHEQREYADVLNRLYEAAPGLSEAFFTIDQRLISAGVRKLLADSLFALDAFIKGGHVIDADFSWPDGPPIHIHEEDPVGTLHALARAMEILCLTVHNPSTEVTPGYSNGNFNQYLLHDPTTQQAPQVGLHIRPFTSESVDREYEFMPDQSIRYRVRLEDGAIDLRNTEQTPDTICIRVDLDRFGAAMDVGALSLNPFMSKEYQASDIERRIGLLLGYGNWLRTQSEAKHPTMNHVRQLNESYNDPELFSLVAGQHRQVMELACRGGGTLAAMAHELLAQG
ncbi:MAG TPA: hypothetical protein VIM53_04165 [Candidatus Saccharimonadales bacterium]